MTKLTGTVARVVIAFAVALVAFTAVPPRFSLALR